MQFSGKKLVIFDLDGTINDSRKGFAYCYRETAKLYGIPNLSDNDLKIGFTGPFDIGIAKVLHLTEEQVPEAVARYVEFYEKEGKHMSAFFPGITEVINYLKDKGYILGVATMMEQGFARDTLSKNSVLDRFTSVCGASFDRPYRKPELIARCLSETGVDAEDAIMIGDGVDDHNSSVLQGIDFIGACYGYGITKQYCMDGGIPGISDPRELLNMF